jgi:lysozyme
MKPSNNCIDLIKRFEGFRGKPYLCPAGIPTIGYGNTSYQNGRSVTLKDPAISVEQAEKLLVDTVQLFAAEVGKLLKVEVTQGQFDALVDFAYNMGASKLAGSTLLRLVNSGDFSGAEAEFGKWVYGGGVKLPGLVLRREAARKLFRGEA